MKEKLIGLLKGVVEKLLDGKTDSAPFSFNLADLRKMLKRAAIIGACAFGVAFLSVLNGYDFGFFDAGVATAIGTVIAYLEQLRKGQGE